MRESIDVGYDKERVVSAELYLLRRIDVRLASSVF